MHAYATSCSCSTVERISKTHKLNMELFIQILFWLLCTAVLNCWDPETPLPAFGLIYEGAISHPRKATSLCNPLATPHSQIPNVYFRQGKNKFKGPSMYCSSNLDIQILCEFTTIVHHSFWKYIVAFADSWMAASASVLLCKYHKNVENILSLFWKYLADIWEF